MSAPSEIRESVPDLLNVRHETGVTVSSSNQNHVAQARRSLVDQLHKTTSRWTTSSTGASSSVVVINNRQQSDIRCRVIPSTKLADRNINLVHLKHRSVLTIANCSYNIAIISETRFKIKRVEAALSIAGYTE